MSESAEARTPPLTPTPPRKHRMFLGGGWTAEYNNDEVDRFIAEVDALLAATDADWNRVSDELDREFARNEELESTLAALHHDVDVRDEVIEGLRLEFNAAQDSAMCEQMLTESEKLARVEAEQAGANKMVQLQARKIRDFEAEQAVLKAERDALKQELESLKAAADPDSKLNVIPKRFWDRVKKTEHGCWEWTRDDGTPWPAKFRYGKVTFNQRRYHAHRVVAEAVYGPIPAHLDVCHTCDNKVCVRPDHLFIGTRSENMLDASRKGRLESQKQNHHRGPRKATR